MWSNVVLYANGQLPQRISHCQVADFSSHGWSTRISICVPVNTRRVLAYWHVNP